MEFIFTNGILMPYKRGCLEPFERAPSDVRDSKYSFEGDLPIRRIHPRYHYGPENLDESLIDMFKHVNQIGFDRVMWSLDVLQRRTNAAALEVHIQDKGRKIMKGSYRVLFRRSKLDPQFSRVFGQPEKNSSRRLDEPFRFRDYMTCPLIDNITL